jgi:methylmalonyl-CoA epimerase
MRVEKIECVCFYVKDLDKATKFFTDLLGLEFSKPFELEEVGARNVMEPLGMELMSPLTPDNDTAKYIERKGEGFAMLGLKVSNLDEAVKEMESKGVRCYRRGGKGKVKSAFFHPKDAHGILFELIEYKAPHPEMPLLGLKEW